MVDNKFNRQGTPAALRTNVMLFRLRAPGAGEVLEQWRATGGPMKAALEELYNAQGDRWFHRHLRLHDSKARRRMNANAVFW